LIYLPVFSNEIRHFNKFLAKNLHFTGEQNKYNFSNKITVNFDLSTLQ